MSLRLNVVSLARSSFHRRRHGTWRLAISTQKWPAPASQRARPSHSWMLLGMFAVVLSARNCTQKRNHHSPNEPRMEQREERSGANQRRPQPSPRATPEAESLPGLRPLNEHAKSLRDKIGCWQPVSGSGGNGNDQIVQETGGEKRTECSGR